MRANARNPAGYRHTVRRTAWQAASQAAVCCLNHSDRLLLMALSKVSAADVRLNTPIPYAIYSDSGKLLLNKGQCIQSERQLDRIFSAGAFRDAHAAADRDQAQGGARVHDPLAASIEAAPAEAEPASTSGTFPTLPSVVESCQLTLDGEGQAPLSVAFVGAIEDQALVVSAPGCDALQPGVAVEAKLLLGRDLCTFRTCVAARSADVPGIVLLAYPASVRRRAVRRHRRVPAAIKAQIMRNDSQCFATRVVDISLEGVGLSLDHCCVDPGEHFRLALRLRVQEKTHTLLLNCVARNVRLRRAGDFLVGAEIRASTVETRALLRGFVFEAATGTTS